MGTRVPIEIVFEVRPVSDSLVKRESVSELNGERSSDSCSCLVFLGFGFWEFAARVSEREDHRDEECHHDPQVEAASHFGSLFKLKEKKRRSGKNRWEVMLVDITDSLGCK